MKLCKRCGIERDVIDFNFKRKKLGIRQKTCKYCTRQMIRNHYYKNRQYYIEKTRKRNKILREELRKYIWNYLLTHPCLDCGERDPVVLEFDHKNNKNFNISHGAKAGYRINKVEIEILKCEVRCANCHRKKTAIERNWYKLKIAPVAQLD